MSFMGAINSVLANYANFQGRAPRSEYWYWFLFTFLAGLVIGIIAGIIDAVIGNRAIGGILQLVFELAILIPSIAVGVRRLHDLDKSGWWIFLGLVPLVGAIILLVWYCTPGTRGSNQYGNNMLPAMA